MCPFTFSKYLVCCFRRVINKISLGTNMEIRGPTPSLPTGTCVIHKLFTPDLIDYPRTRTSDRPHCQLPSGSQPLDRRKRQLVLHVCTEVLRRDTLRQRLCLLEGVQCSVDNTPVNPLPGTLTRPRDPLKVSVSIQIPEGNLSLKRGTY